MKAVFGAVTFVVVKLGATIFAVIVVPFHTSVRTICMPCRKARGPTYAVAVSTPNCPAGPLSVLQIKKLVPMGGAGTAPVSTPVLYGAELTVKVRTLLRTLTAVM